MSAWKPSPALQASFLVHAASLAGLAVAEARPWALAALAANQGVLSVAGLLPRSTLLGANLVRLPAASAARGEVALTIDDGPDPAVTPRVLDLLDAAGARASFFCIGWRARQAPALCREIVARGHTIENHGDAHAHAFAAFGPRRMRADIAAAQQTLGELGGRRPRFFRPTAGLRNPFLDPVLHGLGLRLASWTRRGYDTRCADPATVLSRLARGLAGGDILLLHDGNAARDADGQPVILTVLPRLLARCRAQGLTPVSLDQAVPENV